MAIVGLLSLLILLVVAPVRRVRPNGQMFFLGAGFMLLETKGVVHMALALRRDLDGQLDRVFRDPDHDLAFATSMCIVVQPAAALALLPPAPGGSRLNSMIPMADFLSLPGQSKVDRLVRCRVYTSVLRGRDLRDGVSLEQPARCRFRLEHRRDHPGRASEYLSLVLGFNHLLWVAIGFYLLSALLRGKGQAAGARYRLAGFASPLDLTLGTRRRCRVCVTQGFGPSRVGGSRFDLRDPLPCGRMDIMARTSYSRPNPRRSRTLLFARGLCRCRQLARSRIETIAT